MSITQKSIADSETSRRKHLADGTRYVIQHLCRAIRARQEGRPGLAETELENARRSALLTLGRCQ